MELVNLKKGIIIEFTIFKEKISINKVKEIIVNCNHTKVESWDIKGFIYHENKRLIVSNISKLRLDINYIFILGFLSKIET